LKKTGEKRSRGEEMRKFGTRIVGKSTKLPPKLPRKYEIRERRVQDKVRDEVWEGVSGQKIMPKPI